MESLTRYSLWPERVALALSVVMMALICLHVFWMQAYFNDNLERALASHGYRITQRTGIFGFSWASPVDALLAERSRS